MRNSVLLFAVLFASSAFAQPFERGDVVIHGMWGGCACEPMVPRADITVLNAKGSEKLFISGAVSYLNAFPMSAWGLWVAAPDRILASTEGSVVVSPDLRNVTARFFSDVTQLKLSPMSDILPMRSGDFLVIEAYPTLSNGPRLVKFAASGQVLDVFQLPPVSSTSIDWSHAELLADQCTVAWNGFAHTGRVQAFNICTKQAVPDLVAIPNTRCVGAIRQLPNGDLLVATCDNVRRFTKAGEPVAVYSVPAWGIALTPNASGFWATSSWFSSAEINRVDFATPNVIAVHKLLNATSTSIAVAGEWRASLQPPPRRRAAGH